MHMASIVFEETDESPPRYNLIKNRYDAAGIVSKEEFCNFVVRDPPTEIQLQGETYTIIDPINPSFIWYIEGAPAILMRNSDRKRVYCINRKIYDSEAEYVFNKAIREHQ